MPTTATPRRIDLPFTTEEAAERLRAREGFVWLDTSGNARAGERTLSLMTADPETIVSGRLSSPADAGALRAAFRGLGVVSNADCGMPCGGLFGAVDFDGQFRFGVYRNVLIFDHQAEQWFEYGELAKRLGEPTVGLVPPLDFRPVMTRSDYVGIVQRGLEHIAAGNIYQVNLSQQFVSAWPTGADAFPFYRRLRHFSPAPHSAFIDLGGRQILSASPELFLRLSGSTAMTRPIKGTRPRRRDAQEDERSAYDLITSSKEMAELIMITDLERNDLGQVCDYGTVTVPELVQLERFAQVFHLVSTVRGSLRADVDHVEALQACFPGGSISGAPKRRALEIIRELEPVERGLYTGAIGYWGAGGESQFNIAIRTAVAEAGRLHFHTGAGIVADSDPEREYAETWEKALSVLGAAEWTGGPDPAEVARDAAAGR